MIWFSRNDYSASAQPCQVAAPGKSRDTHACPVICAGKLCIQGREGSSAYLSCARISSEEHVLALLDELQHFSLHCLHSQRQGM